MTDKTDDDLMPGDGAALTARPFDDSPTADPVIKGSAPEPIEASRPTRAQRHLALATVSGEPVEPKTKAKQEPKAKQKRSAPNIETGLTEKQSRFCDGIAEGLSLSDSYRAAYDTSGMSQKVVWQEASKLMANRKVADRLKQISDEKAEQLRMLSASDAAAAVEVFRRMMLTADTDASKIRAAELLAKASGVFTDKVEVTDKTDRSASEIEQSIKDRLAKLGLTG